MTIRKPRRYRDVLTLLKAMARDEAITSDALRALLVANQSHPGYTQTDIDAMHRVATGLGYEITTDPELDPDTEMPVDPAKYQAEIQRLHWQLRMIKAELATIRNGLKVGNAKGLIVGAKRAQQMLETGVQSIDEAFHRLKVLRAFHEDITKAVAWGDVTVALNLAYVPAVVAPTDSSLL